MSFAHIHNIATKIDPLETKMFGGKLDLAADVLGKKTPTAPPAPPNPNDALNASQQQTDGMRMRRGLIGNLYGGLSNQQPAAGKVTLG